MCVFKGSPPLHWYFSTWKSALQASLDEEACALKQNWDENWAENMKERWIPDSDLKALWEKAQEHQLIVLLEIVVKDVPHDSPNRDPISD